MGNCSSCMFMPDSTAKLILLSGELEEYTCPVKVWQVLERRGSNEWFVCDSDEMDFEELVYAIREDEELEPDQLYFLLPLSWLSRPLQAADMTDLAVKACAALKGKDGEKCGCWCGRVDLLMFSGEREMKHARLLPAAVGGKLTRKLSIILEE